MKIPPLEYVSREHCLCEQAAGKKVLHLGCVGDRRLSDGERTLHEKLSDRSRELWGVDLNAAGIQVLADKVPAFRDRLLVGDACRLGELSGRLPGPFDIIIAGDIIEHLTNPADLFCSCEPFLGQRGVLLVTTPNALGLLNVLRAWRGEERSTVYHTCWFSFSTLDEMARRVGWHVLKYWTCYDHEGHAPWKKFVGERFFRLWPQWGGTLIAMLAPSRVATDQLG